MEIEKSIEVIIIENIEEEDEDDYYWVYEFQKGEILLQ
jgi:hypothetical protein